MRASKPRGWSDLSESEQERLDAGFLRDLGPWTEHGLTARGVRVYLDYRRERPAAQITTYEEGQIRRLLRPHVDRSRLPDPVAVQEHSGWLENFGATHLHLTNEWTYLTIMLVLTYLFVLALFVVSFLI